MVAPQADAGSTCAGDGSAAVQVNVLSDSQTLPPQCFTWGELSPFVDVSDATYQSRSTNADFPVFVTAGVSIDALLTASHVNSEKVTYTSVTFPSATNSTGSVLSNRTNDFGDPDASPYPFPLGLPPVFFTSDDGTSLDYLRPQRSSSDQNAVDHLHTQDGQGLTLTVHLSGNVLTPKLTASATTVFVDHDVTFSARTAGADPGEQLNYDIEFRDSKHADSGPIASAQLYRAVHRFDGAGAYYVYVTVEGSHGSSGVSTQVLVQVTAPRPPKKPTTTPKPAPSGSSHGNGGSNAPIGGPVNGSGTHVRGPVTGSSTRPTPLRSASPTTAVPSRTVVPTASRSRTGPTISSTATATPTRLPAAGASSASATGPRRGVAVAGFAAAAALPAGGLDGGSASTPPAPAARSSIDHRANPVAVLAIVLALATLGLLWLGVVAESRRPSRKASRAR